MDVAIAGLVARQHGTVSLSQMQSAGLSASAVRSRVAAGRLHRIHRGVYAVGHRELTREGRWMAAVLACGDGTSLSHRSAAHLWDLRRTERFAVEITSASGRSRRGIDVHHSSLGPADVTTHEGIPVTTVARTLLDLGDVVDRRGLERAVEQADRRRLLDVSALRRTLDEANGRRATAVLADILGTYDPDTLLTRSELEVLFLAVCRDAGIPAPLINRTLDHDEVDFRWPQHRLLVEVDGHDTHGTRQAFERDRHRDQRHAVAGWRTLRFTYRQVTQRRREVAATLEALVLSQPEVRCA